MNPSTLRLDAMHTDLSESFEISDNECDLGEQTLSVNTVDVHQGTTNLKFGLCRPRDGEIGGHTA